MRKILIILLFVVLFVSNSYSQLLSIKGGPMLGLTSAASDYSGETQDFYAGTKYGLKSGFHYGVMGRIAVGPIGGRLSLGYASLSNSGTANPTQNNSTVEVKNNIFMITIGPEFGFTIPFTPVRPYAGIDLLITTISGSVNFQGTEGSVPSNERDITSASRTGLGLAIGSEVGFGKTFILDISLRYNLINLFSKKYEGPSGSNNRIDAYTFVNDDPDPDHAADPDNHPIGTSRNIQTIQINVGLLFGF